MKKVGLVILNWNRKELTVECLESVSKALIRGFVLQIIVVDNASEDGSREVLKKRLKEISDKSGNLSGILLENKENLGFSGGNNVGVKYALTQNVDYILVLNNDTIVDKRLIVEFLKAAKKYPKAGTLSPKMYFAKGYEFHKDRYEKSELGKVIWYAGGEIDWQNVYGKNRGVDEVDKGQYGEVKEVGFATGTCMFFRRDVLKSIDGFDEKYFMYLEDVDLSYRVRKAGWRVLYLPEAILWHKVAQSSGIGGDLNDYFITRNRLVFGIKYAPIRSKIALIKESVRLLFKGRLWQKLGVRDFYLRRFGKGSWNG